MAYLSDRMNKRMPFVLFANALLIVGLGILMTVHSGFSVRYLGVCLVCMGALGAGPSVVCWYLMNLEGHKQRSIGSGWMISLGNTGGILAPFAFLARYAPYYETGYSICMGVAVLGVVTTLSYASLIMLERRRDIRSGKNKPTALAL